MRKYFALAAAVVLAVAGCTSGDDDDVDTSPETTGSSEEPAELGRGVTADTIKIGITYPDVTNLGIANLDHGDYEGSYQALIDDLNERGGINGRTVEAVFSPVNPRGTEGAEAACVQLTEDEQVFLAMGYFGADTVLCALETHSTAVLGGSMSEDRLARAQAPWFTTEAGEDLTSDVIRLFAEEGVLDGDVAVFAQAGDVALLEDTVEPLLDELGIEPVETAVLDSPPGDNAAAVAQAGVIAESFESAGATKVLVVGNNGALGWLGGIENLDYRPQSLFVTTNTVLAYVNDAAGRDLSPLEDAIAGEGYNPGAARFAEEKNQACFEIIEAAGIEVFDPGTDTPERPDTFVSADNACRNMALLEALLTEAGDNLNYTTLEEAGETIGDVDIPGYPEPFHYGPPPSADGDAPVYLFDWDPTEKVFAIRD
ncbi:MAG: ABC transporter substrate-binding protein [Acidimicrobiales bacterium]